MNTSQSDEDEAMSVIAKKTGPELMDEIIQEPTLDRLLDRNPLAQPYSDEELLTLIEAERAERALFNLKDEKRQMKKEGIKDVESNN